MRNEYKIKSARLFDHLEKPVYLKSLPWRNIHPDFSEPPKLINEHGKETTIEKMVQDDIRENLPLIVFSQIDPLIYSFEIRLGAMHHSLAEIKEEMKSDRKSYDKIKAQYKRQINSILHPNQGEDSVIDLAGVEIMYNIEHRLPPQSNLEGVFESMENIIRLEQAGDLTDEEQIKYDKLYSRIGKYVEFSAGRYVSNLNPSPFYDMEKVYASSLRKLMDFSYSDYPHQLHRIILDRIKKLSLLEVKDMFEKVMLVGERQIEKYNVKKLTDIDQKRIAYDLYPEHFVQPRDEYIAKLIYRQTFKNLSCLVYVGEPHFEGVKKLLEDPKHNSDFPFILPNTLYEIEDVDFTADEDSDDLEGQTKEELLQYQKEFQANHVNPNNETPEERIEKQVILE